VVICGDSLSVLADLEPNSVHAVVTDPPYFISFMGRDWDGEDNVAATAEFWRAVSRVLVPGGHVLAFGAPRTYHRLAVAIEDAGLEIRDSLHWMFGSGFPKSLNVSKAIDRAAGAEREVVGTKIGLPGYHLSGHDSPTGAFGHGLGSSTEETRAASAQVTAPATEEAREWEGWGTALKPSHEPVVVARKPLDGTVAENVVSHGAGALNIDGTRVSLGSEYDPTKVQRQSKAEGVVGFAAEGLIGTEIPTYNPGGRWPSNAVLSHLPDCELVGTKKVSTGTAVRRNLPDEGSANGTVENVPPTQRDVDYGYGDPDGMEEVEDWRCASGCAVSSLDFQSEEHGGAARFFPVFRYVTKTRSAERHAGVDRNQHPTVKPVELMRWLVRLVTPPGGTVLDPFLGSGSTGIAAHLEGFDFIGIEMEPKSAATAEARIAFWSDAEPGVDTADALEGLLRRAEITDAGQLGLF
jgi:site-specific DNA-methyltransferase (adenine-specific)